MRLRSLDYSLRVGRSNEWKLSELSLGSVNLLVGKNATGKSRALNVIRSLAVQVSGQVVAIFPEGNYVARFEDEGQGESYQYVLEATDGKVIRESLERDGKRMMERREGGVGKIFAEQLNDFIEFQIPENQLIVATRRDQIQHRFLEPLNQWANGLYFYPFGTDLGRNSLALFVKDPRFAANIDFKDPNTVVATFHKAIGKFPAFKQSMIDAMASVGYQIDDIGLMSPPGVQFQLPGLPLPGEIQALWVKERNFGARTVQNEMSQGMFRALSIIVQINYAVLAGQPSCILIDDIGEGLDFERSCALN